MEQVTMGLIMIYVTIMSSISCRVDYAELVVAGMQLVVPVTKIDYQHDC